VIYVATCERETKHAYVRDVDGVEEVLLPTNVKYMIVETGGVLGRIRSFGRRRPADTYEFLLPAFTNCKNKKRPYYIDGVNKCGNRVHLEVTAKAVKTGVKTGEGGATGDVYKLKVEKVVDADSRWGPLRKKKRILEVTQENMKILQEFNFAPL